MANSNSENLPRRLLEGRSTIPGAMGWMFGLSLILSLLLGWVPVVGPFVGPVVGGPWGVVGPGV